MIFASPDGEVSLKQENDNSDHQQQYWSAGKQQKRKEKKKRCKKFRAQRKKRHTYKTKAVSKRNDIFIMFHTRSGVETRKGNIYSLYWRLQRSALHPSLL